MIDLSKHNLIAIDKDKQIESITYTDGTCDMFLDLPYDVLSILYGEAHRKKCDINQVILDSIKFLLDKEKEKTLTK